MAKRSRKIQAAPAGSRGFRIEEAFGQAWGIVIRNFGTLTLALLIFAGLEVVNGSLDRVVEEGDSHPLKMTAAVLEYLFCVPLLIWVRAGFMATGIRWAAGGEVSLADFFPSLRRTFAFFLGNVVLVLLFVLGCLFLIVPGFLLVLRYLFGPYLMVHRGLSLREAFDLSARMTEGQKGHLFLFLMVSFLALGLGFLACCIGILWAAALVQVAWALVYWKLLKQTRADLAGPVVP
jgi:uncharacterized membrane protein